MNGKQSLGERLRERLAEQYTVLVMPHSQRKPVRFKVRVWAALAVLLTAVLLIGTCFFLTGYLPQRHQAQAERAAREQLTQEKAALERSLELLEAEKQQAELEIEALREELETLQEEAPEDTEENAA